MQAPRIARQTGSPQRHCGGREMHSQPRLHQSWRQCVILPVPALREICRAYMPQLACQDILLQRQKPQIFQRFVTFLETARTHQFLDFRPWSYQSIPHMIGLRCLAISMLKIRYRAPRLWRATYRLGYHYAIKLLIGRAANCQL